MSGAATRLTRAQKKAETRSALLRAATVVFARQGMERASIDDVAHHAGFTKGAFYANFASKEELFLALLDEHFADVLDRVERAISSDEDMVDQAREGAASFMAFIEADPDWERLFFDFSAYGMRNPAFGAELAARRRDLREGIAALLRRRVDELGIEPPLPIPDIAMMVFAMGDGVALQRLLDPDSIDAELYPSMLATFFAGLQAGR